MARKIGSGAFGDIYQGILPPVTFAGQNLKTNEEVAIKLVSDVFVIRRRSP